MPVILDALTKAAGAQAARRAAAPAGHEADVLKKYSEALVRKLEDKNLDLEKSLERLGLAHEIDQAIITSNTPAQIAEAVLPRLRDLLGMPRVIVNMFDLQKNEAEWLVAVGRHRAHVGPGVRYSLDVMGDLEGAQARRDAAYRCHRARVRGPEAAALLASDVRWFMVVADDRRRRADRRFELRRACRASFPPTASRSRAGCRAARDRDPSVRLDERARQADAQYRLVFENVPVGITMTGADGRHPVGESRVGADAGLCLRRGGDGRAARTIRRRALCGCGRAGEVPAQACARMAPCRRFEVQAARARTAAVWASLDGRVVIRTSWARRRCSSPSSTTSRCGGSRSIAYRAPQPRQGNAKRDRLGGGQIRERQALLDEVCRIAVDTGGLRAAWVGWHDAGAAGSGRSLPPGPFDGFLDLVSLSTADAVSARRTARPCAPFSAASRR